MTQGGLLEYNPASHAIWWVGGVALIAIAVLIVVDLIVEWRIRRSGSSPANDSADSQYRLPKAESHLRKRHFRRITATWRTFRGSSPNRRAQ
jgi:hypothetical protein